MKVSKKVSKKQSYKEWQEGKQARNKDIKLEITKKVSKNIRQKKV